MDRKADLDSALSFVIGRIGEQAVLSGEPLSEEQRILLNYLSPSSTPAGWGPEILTPVPRNINYERLRALGRAAYLNDRRVNPASLDWEFAFAVFTLNRHPMWGLLQQAGLKHRRPLGDQLLLMITALLLVMVVVLVAWTPFKSIGIGVGCGAILFFVYFASRRLDERRLLENIERCRLASRFG
jgi:hypothetical protein